MCRYLTVCLALAVAACAQTKMDGSRAHELTMDFVTPHLEWAESLPGGPLDALFVITLSQARQVVEVAQRMPLAYSAVTTALRTPELAIVSHPAYSELYTGTGHDAKVEELLAKLEEDHEVYVITWVDLKDLPARAKLRILERVHAGAGLVLYGIRDLQTIKPVFAQPTPAGEAAIQALAPADPNLHTYSFGAGRVVVASRMNVAPFHYQGPDWWADYENANVLLMRTLLWAAGRELTTAAAEPTRIRDRWNKIVTADEARLPTGTYYADLVNAASPGVREFTVDTGVTAELTLATDATRDFDPIPATLKLNEAVPNGRAVISLIDLPYEREWYRREMPLADGTEVAITVADYFMPALAAVVRVQVFSGDRPVATANAIAYFPWHVQHLPAYYDTLWEFNPGGMDRIRAIAEYDVMGYAGCYNRIDGDRPPPQTYWRLNLLHGAHNFGFNLGGIEKSGGMTEEERELVESLAGDLSPGNPDTEAAIRVIVRGMIRHKALDRYPLAFYGMGNETKLPYTTGFADADRRFFEQMLATRYGDVAALNREWGRDFAGFADVPNMPMEDARVQGLYPEYLAHRRLVDETVRQRFATITDEVNKIDPFAPMGCDGTWSLSNDGVNIEALFANPRVNHWEQYSRLPRAEVLRSLRPAGGGYLWGWIMANNAYPEAPWFNLTIGCANHANFFLSGCSVGGCQLAADYRPWRPRMTAELEILRTGVAQLLNTTPLHADGLAIWESYDSNVAGLLGDPRLPQSTDTSMPLIEYTYQHGLTFDFVVRRGMAETLKKYKVLVLPGTSAVSAEEERELVAWVRAGGTVIADVNPGIMNDSFAFLERNRLAELFGEFDPKAVPERGPLAVETELNGRRLALACDAANQVPGIAPMQVREVGKGRAILLNFTLGSARESTDSKGFDRFLTDLLAACGVAPAVRFDQLTPDSVARVRQGNGFLLVGVTQRRLASAGRDGTDEIVLELPTPAYVYDLRTGKMVHGSRVPFTLAPPFRLFGVFPQAQEPPAVKLTATTLQRGGATALDLRPFGRGRVLHLALRGPDGKLVNPRREAVNREVILVGDAPTQPVHFPYNAPTGQYTLTVKDIATGLATTADILVQP